MRKLSRTVNVVDVKIARNADPSPTATTLRHDVHASSGHPRDGLNESSAYEPRCRRCFECEGCILLVDSIYRRTKEPWSNLQPELAIVSTNCFVSEVKLKRCVAVSQLCNTCVELKIESFQKMVRK